MNCECGLPSYNLPPHVKRDVWIVELFPHVDKQGYIHSIEPDHQKILREEFLTLGLDISRIYYNSVWKHVPGERRSKLGKEVYARCENKFFTEFYTQAVEFGAKGVLLYGSDAVKIIAGVKVSEYSSLSVDVPLLGVPVVVACEKAGKTIGETRLAIHRFIQKINKL